MPFYDLTCTACGVEYNKKASMAERETGNISCPECNATNPSTRYIKRNSLQQSSKDTAPACPNAHICGGSCRH